MEKKETNMENPFVYGVGTFAKQLSWISFAQLPMA